MEVYKKNILQPLLQCAWVQITEGIFQLSRSRLTCNLQAAASVNGFSGSGNIWPGWLTSKGTRQTRPNTASFQTFIFPLCLFCEKVRLSKWLWRGRWMLRFEAVLLNAGRSPQPGHMASRSRCGWSARRPCDDLETGTGRVVIFSFQ